MSKHCLLPVVLVLAALAAPLCAQEQKLVAKVNDQPITEAQFLQQLQDWFGREVLEEMIQTEIIAQATGKAKVTVTAEQVDARAKEVQDSMDQQAAEGKGEPFTVWLATHRLSIANFKSRIRTDLLLEALVAPQIKVTSGEVSAYYEKNKEMFREPTRVKISVISVKTQEEAVQLRDQITKSKKTWGDVARDSNVNPLTMKTGGEFGYVTEDDTPLRKAAFELQHDGEICVPFQYGGLWNLVKRDDRRNARLVPFEETKASIEQALKEQKTRQMKAETRTGLMKSAHIERLVEFPPKPTP